MEDFYVRTVAQLLTRQWLNRDSAILVVCGGHNDREVLRHLGFHRVTISNLDARMRADEFEPYPWSSQDAEQLSFRNEEFDYVIVHQGLHHCYSPHRALLEMLRVARLGVIVFEPRDTLLVRLGVRLSFGQEYEVAAVAGNGLAYGGVRNSAMPNYVYRWSEREIEKTVHTCLPAGRCRIEYFYALRIPHERLRTMKNRLVARTLRMLLPGVRLLTTVFPRQTNCFAFAIRKPELPGGLHPWLVWNAGEPAIDEGWVARHYDIVR